MLTKELKETLDNLTSATVAELLAACGKAIAEDEDLQTCIKDMDFEGKPIILDMVFMTPHIAILARECALRLGGNEVMVPFLFGNFARETWELAELGWQYADKHIKECRELASHKKDAQSCVRLLEVALYDSASRGDTTDKVKALNYFKARLQPREAPLLGEHILSGFTALCAVSLICLGGMFVAKASCGNNGSGFCGDVNTITSHVTSYFTEYKK